MVSTRAANVAEVLFELKRAGKVATYSDVAKRAGFTSGTNNRTITTALKHVKRDWPHLQWWRAIKEDGVVEAEQAAKLRESGVEIETSEIEGKKSTVQIEMEKLEDQMMVWEEGETVQSKASGEEE